jgi:predicted RNA-binding protein with PUA domain
MQKSYFLPDKVNLHIHRPTCRKCGAHMILARITPARVGFDVRTFECHRCDLIHEVLVETNAFGQSFTPTA